MTKQKDGRVQFPGNDALDRVTAMETIDGIQHVIVLERRGHGRYREISVTRCDADDALPPAAPNGSRADSCLYLG